MTINELMSDLPTFELELELEAIFARQDQADTYLTQPQAASYLDELLTVIQDSTLAACDCVPECAPVWENGLLNCIESTPSPIEGIKLYSVAKLDAWFTDCYEPSILCNKREAA
ncbi:MAG: hypothetical protein CTY16_11085 [Methylobacter sp.]|nr:MAG: hypothetical protein CTY16_11085 [Methylobacter sp.]